VDRVEAEAIYDAGREVVVEVLLRMDRRIQQLEARVEKLERELKRSSRNSSRPPSSDPPSSPMRSKDPSDRKRGAQPGHEGHGRPLLPAWAVDEVIDHWPERCKCGHVFSADERVSLGEPARHQVEELPPITVRVTERRCRRLRCPGCGSHSRAQLPAEVAASCFGARLEAAVATLSVRNRVSRDDAVELAEELFAARISSGTVDAIIGRTAEALAEAHEDLLNTLRGSEALNMDETGWRTAGARRALWGLFDREHAYFEVAPDRHEERARELLAATPLRSSPRTAGGPIRTCPWRVASSVGLICAATSRRTPKDSRPRGSSARWAWSSQNASSGRGRSLPTRAIVVS
jgi:transposase